MHQLRVIILLIGIVLLSKQQLLAEQTEFQRNNPDVEKYEFARSYIPAISYFNTISQRWSKTPPKKKYPKDDFKVIRASMEYLVLDNVDLRIAKNYMVKYLSSKNALIKKAADTLIVVCEQDIALNNEQKKIWADWLIKKNRDRLTANDEKDFIKAHQQVELKRKESDQQIIKASLLMTKVLLSQENLDEKGHQLAITRKQREKLLDLLDSFGKDVMDWGLKPGQSTLSASIAVIREVLEDPIYITPK